MRQERVLAVTICSKEKTGGGISRYSSSGSLKEVLPHDSWTRLVEARDSALGMLRDSQVRPVGMVHRIGEIDVNRALRRGPDLGGQDTGTYLPAVVRYAGGYYRALGDPTVRLRRVAERPVVDMLILSGLYGLVRPTELIQEYDYYACWDDRIYELWRDRSGATEALISYIQAVGAGLVLDLTGIDAYRALVRWQDLIAAGANVLRAEPSLAGDEGLDLLGLFTSEWLLGSDGALCAAFNDGATFPCGNERVRLLAI